MTFKEKWNDAWDGFQAGKWNKEVNLRDFIQLNYTPYDGDDSFLAGPTQNTKDLWDQVMDLTKKERDAGGVLDMDTKIVSTLTSHDAGYLDRSKETIVGVQTDKPFKRSLQPFGGIRIAEQACETNGYKVDPEISYIFREYRKTHNQGVFDVYTPEIRACRSAHIITGLPDGYGRGRIIGDYRRVALYGVDKLIDDKKNQLATSQTRMTSKVIQLREELSEQIRALGELKEMAAKYGIDISKPATNCQEAIQWLYFGYLGAVKEQNGAAMSLGRTSTFIDIYVERDLKNGVFTEEQIQEFIDHFIMKLRIVKFARTPDYNAIFAGDPTWVTESIGGVGVDGRHMVTKTSFRYLHTLSNLGTAPEPNMTVLWSTRLPANFKAFCAKTSIETSSVQYENDDLMRVTHGDDYAIACCVSSMRVGKEMQFFGARANLAKCLLYAINGGVDEKSKKQVGPKYRPVEGEYLDYDDVVSKYVDMMAWLAKVYVNALNIIHYMHDKYAYERLTMAFHDTEPHRWMAFGISGLSVLTDSLSAIKYAKVTPIKDERGVIVDFKTEGEFPKYGNDDDRVDSIAKEITDDFYAKLKKTPCYRGATHTLSVLTITSNVVYGRKTGNTPDGRRAKEPFAPGANPMHGRDASGAVASLSSVSKLNYDSCRDGISNTFSVTPEALGKDKTTQIRNLTTMLDGYFGKDAHHLNVNVLNRDLLIDAMNNPGKYPTLTVRVSGYAVNFNKLTRDKQEEVIARTFHQKL